jgi:uncharacterized MnhB-related membrane protein
MTSDVSALSSIVANSHQTLHLVSPTPSKIPYGGFSPVRLQTRLTPRPPSPAPPRWLISRHCSYLRPLFGFQLIAVFNTRFHDFSSLKQILHLVALLLVAVAVALIMTPAAYHRIAERGMVSRRSVDVASRFLESAPMPLILGISLDLFLLGRLLLNNVALSDAIAGTMFLLFLALWYVFPWAESVIRLRRKEVLR